MAHIQNPVDLLAKNNDGEAERLVCDNEGILATLPSEHYRIHNGQGFMAGYMWGENTSPISSVADNATVEILIQANSGMHTIFDIAASGDCEVRRYKGVTFSDAGIAITAFNKNEYSANTTTNVITHTPTITDYGTELPPSFLPGGTGGNAMGGQDGGFNRELILKSGVDYLVTITNRKGLAAIIAALIEWYETT